MKNENMGLMPSFGNSLFSCISDSVTDTADCVLDNLSEAILTGDLKKYIPIIQDLPIINYFVSAGKMVATVRDQLFLKKTLKFISELNNGKLNESEVKRRQEALSNKEKWIYDELEILISTLEQLDRMEKTKIVSEIYKMYINGEIDKYIFDDLCGITERLFLPDIVQLRAEYEDEQEVEESKRKETNETVFVTEKHTRYVDVTGRLLALGLMRLVVKNPKNICANDDVFDAAEYTLSRKGKLYMELLSRLNFLDITEKRNKKYSLPKCYYYNVGVEQSNK